LYTNIALAGIERIVIVFIYFIIFEWKVDVLLMYWAYEQYLSTLSMKQVKIKSLQSILKCIVFD